MIILGEQKQDTSVSFQLSRQKGLFGKVDVYWELWSHSNATNASKQINPTEGIVSFDQNVNSQSIKLTVKADMVCHFIFLYFGSANALHIF